MTTSYKGFRPTQDGILIRRDEAPKTSGLLHIPDGAQKAPKTGVGRAVGPGRRRPGWERTGISHSSRACGSPRPCRPA